MILTLFGFKPPTALSSKPHHLAHLGLLKRVDPPLRQQPPWGTDPHFPSGNVTCLWFLGIPKRHGLGKSANAQRAKLML